ncbi:MAG TPA: cytochrome c oxidase assembly protein [Gaiellaceae bacterium]
MGILTSATNWPLGVPFVVCVVLALLYAQGGRGRARDPRRAAAFYGGIAATVLALDTPIDAYADRLFCVHMFQHVLLLSVAPPLLVLGRPWPRLWQPLPVAARRGGARAFTAGAPLAHPAVALALLATTMGAWHVPALYDATLRSNVVHQLEHLTFVLAGILFWGVVIGTPPLRRRLNGALRVGYFVLAMVPGWILAIVLAFAHKPLYSYAALAHRPGGISALADQQLAAGVMWVPGSLAYVIAACWALYTWLEPEGSFQRTEGRSAPCPSPVTWRAGS